jgi:hypothetical protein
VPNAMITGAHMRMPMLAVDGAPASAISMS